MAKEIGITVGFQVANGSSKRPSNVASYTADQSAIGIGENTADMTTTDTSVSLPISSPGWVQLRNDGSNPIEWGPDNGSGSIAVAGYLLPGAPHQVQLPSSVSAIRARSTTGTSKLSIVALRA